MDVPVVIFSPFSLPKLTHSKKICHKFEQTMVEIDSLLIVSSQKVIYAKEDEKQVFGSEIARSARARRVHCLDQMRYK